MNLQADISWIRAELTKVTDPKLILTFKKLLEDKAAFSKPDFDLAMKRALEDKVAGRVKSHEVIREKYKKWL